MPPTSFSSEELIAAATEHYHQKNWVASSTFSVEEEKLVSRLSLRPDAIAKRDGMEHLIYAIGKVKDVTFKHFKQVLYDIEHIHEFCHVVAVCTERVSHVHESALKTMGLGVLLVRRTGIPIELLHAQLCCFHVPNSYDRMVSRVRPTVRVALEKISCEDVCVGILDLAQILEKELKRKIPGSSTWTLGRLISSAKAKHLLNDLSEAAAKRVNRPRIKRAHAAGHPIRRKVIVMKTRNIVDDCLAVLFALG